MVIWFLDLNKSQWQSVYKTCYVRSEAVSTILIFTSEFSSYVPFVTISIFEVYQFDIAIGRQFIIKLPSKVIIVKY